MCNTLLNKMTFIIICIADLLPFPHPHPHTPAPHHQNPRHLYTCYTLYCVSDAGVISQIVKKLMNLIVLRITPLDLLTLLKNTNCSSAGQSCSEDEKERGWSVCGGVGGGGGGDKESGEKKELRERDKKNFGSC